VTGATSFIGRALCRCLRDSGHEVLALIRPSSSLAGLFAGEPGIRPVLSGVADCESALLPLGPIDAVIHLAWDGIGSQGRADAGIQAANYRHSMNLVTTAARVGCRVFVGGGSQAEYGRVAGVITEESRCDPLSEYGKAKLRFTVDGGRLCRERGLRCRMPRLFSVYGPGDHPWALLPSLVQALAAGQVLPLTDCRQSWNYLYVEDAARALAALVAPACEDGIYNVASEVTRPLEEFVRVVCGFFPGSPPPHFGAIPHGPDGPLSLQPQITRLRRNTSWQEQTTFAEGIRTMLPSRDPAPPSEK